MFDRPTAEIRFVEHLDWIDRVAAMACQDRSLPRADAEDFASWVKTKLMADNYGVIRNFRGESGLKTYLTTVVTRQFQEYLRERWGRWRTSAAAERIGPPAPELESLVYREGYSLPQAGEKLRTAGRTEMTDAELARVLERLPDRRVRRPMEVELESAEWVPDDGTAAADEALVAAETDARRRQILGALERAMEQLDPQDRVIMRLHFADGFTLADVARALRVEQKPLYRRVERLRKLLRALLEAEGIRAEDISGMLTEPGAP